jgi:DNA polymerase-3 subunit epsilon
MLICGIDFEATSLDTKQARIVEIGAVLWDTQAQMPMRLYSTLVDPEMEIPQETTEITGITDAMIQCHAVSENYAIEALRDMANSADYCMAHYGTLYDFPLWTETLKRLDLEDETMHPWIDLAVDVKFPTNITTRNLRHLAAEHDFLNPFSHRALTDVLTMLKVASHYEWSAIIARAKEPTLFVQALVDFKTNQKAKDFQFRWHPDSKRWWKAMKASDFEAEKSKWEFQYNMLLSAPE